MTPERFFRQSKRFQDTWNRVVHAISRMRADRVSLQQAAREFGVSPSEVVRLSGSALRKTPSGRYAAKANDSLLRVINLPGKKGLREVALGDSREASVAGRYWDAVRLYLQTGDASALREFVGQSVWDAGGRRVELLTDLDELDRLGSAGVLSFESIYAGGSR
jgi:AraC-like DNA-binding protein